ncbi:phage tail protein [Halodesulfovibrio sp.]|uniref:phage tail protein n=1 Tax=Halodesulfovibrio sp. TaxID=1912772 RepID=UPI0025C2D2E6|nr:phage tail protein [Halodesulfovibrio sp.]
MAQKYYPQITRVGLSKLASASLLGQKLTLTHMALGDGENPVLDLDATALTHEVHRAAINEVVLDENVANRVNIALVIPVDVGGFTITELGIFDSDGDLIAISRFPKTYKPGLNEGSGREIRVQMKLQLSNSELIEITVDQSLVLATKQDLSDHIKDPTPHELPLDSGEAGQVLIKQADGGVAWGTIAGVPVGQLCFSTNGEALAGTIPVNVKQKVLCSAYPQLFEWMKGGDYLRTESAWDAEAAAQDGTCGKYCWDGGEWFILPCYTRYFAAAHAGKEAGSWDDDAIRRITGSFRAKAAGNEAPLGAFYGRSAPDGGSLDSSAHGVERLGFDSSLVVPTAEENRPKTSYVLPCIKAFDVPVNAAHVDMLALAQQVAAINGNKVDKGDLDYLNRVDHLLSTRSTTGIWTITGVTIGRPLLIFLEGDAASPVGYATISLVSGILPKTGQPIVFGNVSNYPRPVTGVFIPSDQIVVVSVSALTSSPVSKLHAYQ